MPVEMACATAWPNICTELCWESVKGSIGSPRAQGKGAKNDGARLGPLAVELHHHGVRIGECLLQLLGGRDTVDTALPQPTALVDVPIALLMSANLPQQGIKLPQDREPGKGLMRSRLQMTP
jgi:hypothetical protein